MGQEREAPRHRGARRSCVPPLSHRLHDPAHPEPPKTRPRGALCQGHRFRRLVAFPGPPPTKGALRLRWQRPPSPEIPRDPEVSV